jgi:putative endonuclease
VAVLADSGATNDTVTTRLDQATQYSRGGRRGARSFYVYILTNRIGGTLYIGVTNDLVRRVYEHKSNAAESFTKRHDVNRMVYFECFDDIEQAIHREKRLKKWTRAWKISLIEKDDPNWIDLYPQIAGQ